MESDLLSNLEIRQNIIDNCLSIKVIEACGLICKDSKGVISVVKAVNTSPDPFDNFLISGTFIRQISEEKDIIGYYHSHNSGDARPSIEDLAVINKLKKICVIYDNKSKQITETHPSIEEFIPPFDKRPFIAGVLDCSELVKDYYKKSLNIELPKLNHMIKFMSWDEIKEKWNSLQHFNQLEYNFFLDYFLSNGFQEINANNLQKNDIILCRSREIKAPIHALIYLGNDKILHHPSNRLSEYTYYDKFYKRLSVRFVRYKV